MTEGALREPLGTTLPWLLRWQGSRKIEATTCLLPECRKVIPRHSTQGPPSWYCDEHQGVAIERRNDLLNAIDNIQTLLDTTPPHTRGFDRRAAESDIQFLRRVLVAYPPLTKPDAPRARRKPTN